MKLLLKHKALSFSILIFLIMAPMAANIDYVQNDEYTHYRQVTDFLKGNYYLDSYLGATFVLQGFMATIFSFFFGIQRIPVLTLLVSVSAIYFLVKTLTKYIKIDFTYSIILSLFLLFNPLFVYSSFGFMTENYFLFFLSMSVFFVFKFLNTSSTKDLILANIVIFLGYLVRQLSFVTSAALLGHLVVKKDYKRATLQFVFLSTLLLFHYKIFPLTPQMLENNLKLETVLDFDRSSSMVFIFLGYISVFLLPLLSFSFLQILKDKAKIKKLLLIPVLVLLANFVQKDFNPGEIIYSQREREGTTFLYYGKSEFPWIENIFERKGFLTSDIPGTKYHYSGFFDLFKVLEVIAILGGILLTLVLLFYVRTQLNFTFFYFIGYCAVLLIAPKIYDRYLLPLFFISIIYFGKILTVHGKLFIASSMGWLFFLFFISYQYQMDFYHLNKYVWNKAEEISESQNYPKKYINPTHAWRQLFPTDKESKKWVYEFKYNPIEERPTDQCCLDQIAEHEIYFPGSIYINPKVYVFKRKDL